jgi:hypothetical protein
LGRNLLRVFDLKSRRRRCSETAIADNFDTHLLTTESAARIHFSLGETDHISTNPISQVSDWILEKSRQVTAKDVESFGDDVKIQFAPLALYSGRHVAYPPYLKVFADHHCLCIDAGCG